MILRPPRSNMTDSLCPYPSLFRSVVGAEFRLDDGLRLVLLVEDRTGYSQLCRLITVARRAAEKGEYRLGRADVEREAFDNDATGLFALWLPGADRKSTRLNSSH